MTTTKLPNYLITIDTEPDCDIKWNRRNPETFQSVTYGIPKLLRPIWDKHQVKPIYFVSPQVVKNEACCQVLKQEIKKGAIIGAHLHSEFIEPQQTLFSHSGKPSNEYPCNLTKAVEQEKLYNLKQLISSNLDYDTVWYRAARYGADLQTMQFLKEVGFKYDSSVTPELNWKKQGGPNHSTAPLKPYWISKHDYYTPASSKEESLGIKEFPITIKGKRFGALGKLLPNNWLFYNWLRPTHMTVWEQGQLIKQIPPEGMTYTLMFHSMEPLINQSPYVRNTWMQKRFLQNLDAVTLSLSQLQ